MKSFTIVASVFALAFFVAPMAHATTPLPPTYACPEYYAPVCGAQPVQCVAAPCYPQYKTYSNTCFLNGEQAALIHEGQCTAGETGPYKGEINTGTYTPPEGCMAWFDGCNSCSRASANGPAMCTLMACASDNHQPGYCRSYEVPKPPVDGDTPVVSPGGGSGTSAGSPGEPIPVDIDGGIGDTPGGWGDDGMWGHEGPPPSGFFGRLWGNITNWFSSIFD